MIPFKNISNCPIIFCLRHQIEIWWHLEKNTAKVDRKTKIGPTNYRYSTYCKNRVVFHFIAKVYLQRLIFSNSVVSYTIFAKYSNILYSIFNIRIFNIQYWVADIKCRKTYFYIHSFARPPLLPEGSGWPDLHAVRNEYIL